ncbi:hypothetical protein [Victivallis vadensis]|jgi:hypothetical protein|uniref:hypothetical protein n=1 Tax=Victivallis vadensis TaxID=172901 RepID=UPI003D046CFD
MENRVILGIIVDGEICRGFAAAALAASIINRKAGHHVTYSLAITKALEKTGKATIAGCKVSYHYL